MIRSCSMEGASLEGIGFVRLGHLSTSIGVFGPTIKGGNTVVQVSTMQATGIQWLVLTCILDPKRRKAMFRVITNANNGNQTISQATSRR